MKRMITDYFGGHSVVKRDKVDTVVTVTESGEPPRSTQGSGASSIDASANCTSASSTASETEQTDSCITVKIVRGDKQEESKKSFHFHWLQKWPWLKKLNTGMVCELCQKHNKVNAMTSPNGCQNYRTSTLERHAVSADHKNSIEQELLKKDFNVVCILWFSVINWTHFMFSA